MMFLLAQPGSNHSSKGQHQGHHWSTKALIGLHWPMYCIFFGLQLYCCQLLMVGFTLFHGCESQR